MIIYPAIDLKSGNCVRLYQGDMNKATIFNKSPVNQAQFFVNQGFKFLHIVDLDGAVTGNSTNYNSIKEILNNVSISIQLGGGIRTLQAIEKWIQLGVNRIILGTVALKNPDLVKEAAKEFTNKIIVAIDAKDGLVATEGWVNNSEISAISLAKKFEDAGVISIIYTDINRDGTGNGIDLEGTKKLKESVRIPIIASGGIDNIKDVENVKKIGVDGLIIGRALYDKKISIKELSDLND